jgi:Cu-processing system ATP-binding protein
MSTLFETHRLGKRYGKKAVLDEVTLKAGEGQVLALLGHNGAGKTTLIKLLLGLTRPSAGHLSLLGGNPAGPQGREIRRAIGYLPENIAFARTMTGRELLGFYAALKGVEPRQCDELLETVGLSEAAGRRVVTYSKGMRQRLGLAQAVLGRPRLLFLDEPTSGLDPPLRRQFYADMGALARGGTTSVVSSHMLTEIEAKADHFAILSAGRLVAHGRMEELRAAAGLPVRLRLKVAPDAVGGIAEEIGSEFALAQCSGGVMDFLCDTHDKMAIVRRVAKLNGVIRDVEILPPGLEEIYAHFVEPEKRS